jgi:hypothetical protein
LLGVVIGVAVLLLAGAIKKRSAPAVAPAT